MTNYLREWNKHIILVRPIKWDGAEEIAPWDCLDITDARLEYQKYTLPPFDVNDYITDGIFTSPPRGSVEVFRKHPIIRDIEENFRLYRSIPFCNKHVDNPRLQIPFFGCSIIAAEALFFLTPEYHKPQLFRALDEEGEWHWWVENLLLPEPDKKLFPHASGWETNPLTIQDATVLQWAETSFPAPYDYKDGKKTRPSGYRQSPSKRTLDLIERMTPSSKRYRCLDKSYAPPHSGASLDAFFSDAD